MPNGMSDLASDFLKIALDVNPNQRKDIDYLLRHRFLNSSNTPDYLIV
jgi:hypothetical protein